MMSENKKRRSLAKGNEYYTGPSKSRRFRIADPWIRGPNPGVAVQWLNVGGGIERGQFFLVKSEEEFWSYPLFENVIDAEVE